MKWFINPLSILALACGLVLAEPSPSPSPEKAEPEFDIPVPEGMPVRGIKIPHRDENGELLMVFEAEVAQRIDENRIEMQNLRIDAFDDDGKKVFIELPHSIFNLETRILAGDRNALIKREDFEITGDSVEFNTRTRNGIVRGNVKMTILTPDE
ncbi:MAG: hypothetical protein SFU53_02920 [Terrimicrobiaceae bacterium]|nr:hypothetical protein [Terrimicrobiaceae bacterium]